MSPEISIIVPFYKTPKLRMRKCIESIIGQSFQNWELLLVDDGNDADYIAFAAEYTQKDGRIQVLHQEHSGVSFARNNGLKAAKGNYICFIDSDDFVDGTYLQRLYEAIQGCDLAICAVAEQFYPTFEGWVDKHIFWSRPTHYNGLQYINFCHNKLYKKEIIANNNLTFDVGVKLGEDALFLDKYFDYCQSIRCVPEFLYHYVPDAASAVHRFRPEFWQWEKVLIEKQWARFHTYNLREWQEQAMLSWLYRKFKYALYYYLEKDTDKKHAKEIIKDIRNHPLFKELKRCSLKKTNNHLSRNDRIILILWKICKQKGIYLTWTLKKLKHH